MKNLEGMTNEQIQYWYSQSKKPNWKCEEPLRVLCDKFNDLFPECTPAIGNRSSWYAGLRKILREFGEIRGIGFIEYARREFDPRLSIVDAHSIMYLAPKFKKRGGDRCPECGLDMNNCRHDWGSQKRNERYGN